MNKWMKTATLAALASGAAPALASTTMPLNTGYDHGVFAGYPAPPLTGASPIVDQYWIKIASYEPPAASTSVAPANVIQKPAGWATPLPDSHWIGPKATHNSATGSTLSNPAYSVFRKCFCLMKGFKQAQLNFRMRADDNVQVWFNSVTNTLLPPQNGHWGATTSLLSGQTLNGFRTGKNCIYVLVEDTGGSMGFTLAGTVSAVGLMPQPAKGVEQSFAPCNCEGGPVASGAAKKMMDEEAVTVAEIVKIAEQRRLSAARGSTPIESPKLRDAPQN